MVNGVKFPIVRMEWVDGISFKRFLADNIHNPARIRDFADKFLEMVKELHKSNISHGDLQHGNTIVRRNGAICLIDYDGLYVPKLSNEKDDIKGLDGYQHPNRKKLDKLSSKSDYFSELVIYLSLLAISEKPSYWKDIEKEERLLFSDKDLKDLENSHPPLIFAELKNLSSEIKYFTLELEKFCKESSVELLQPLENLANAYKGKILRSVSHKVTPTSSPSPTSTNSNNVQSSDPWSKLDITNQSGAWDKMDGSQAPIKDTWDKIDQHDQNEQTELATDENIWNKFDDIWNKALKSASTIWNIFVKRSIQLWKIYKS